MVIQLNGEQRAIEAGITVAGLLQHLGVRLDQVAVEVNLEIMEKGGFETQVLKEGDRVEVMSFIGGGAHHVSFIPSVIVARSDQNIQQWDFHSTFKYRVTYE